MAFLGWGITLWHADDRVAPALLRGGGLLALRFLALALDAGLLVVLASASLGEDAALLDLLVEASQGTLEGLVFAYADFSQSGITSHRRDFGRHSQPAPGSDQRVCAGGWTGPNEFGRRVEPRQGWRSLPLRRLLGNLADGA